MAVIFWLIAGVLMVAAVLAIVAPILRDRRSLPVRAEHGLAVLRDQLEEVERDLDAGRIDSGAAEAARLEIQRRLLAEADRVDSDPSDGDEPAAGRRRRRFAAAAAVIFLAPAGTLALYLTLGSPGMRDMPLSTRSAERTELAERETRRRGLVEMAAGLEARLREQPADGEGWMLLGRTYQTLGEPGRAADAFRGAVEQGGSGAPAYAQLGEALVRAADGVVGSEAKQAFFRALEGMPGEPRSRYYLGLADRQEGDIEGALDWWVELEADTPSGAPWRAMLSRRIDEAAATAGIDVAALRARSGGRPADDPGPGPGPRGPTSADVERAREMAPDDRLAMIEGMVESLAARLEDNPEDVAGWRRLGRSYLVLNQRAKATEAYREAASRAPDDVEVQLDYAHALFPPGSSERDMPQAFIEVIGRVRELEPANPEGLFFGGMIAARRGDGAQARELWGRLLEVLPDDSPVREAIERRIETLDGS